MVPTPAELLDVRFTKAIPQNPRQDIHRPWPCSCVQGLQLRPQSFAKLSGRSPAERNLTAHPTWSVSLGTHIEGHPMSRKVNACASIRDLKAHVHVCPSWFRHVFQERSRGWEVMPNGQPYALCTAVRSAKSGLKRLTCERPEACRRTAGVLGFFGWGAHRRQL